MLWSVLAAVVPETPQLVADGVPDDPADDGNRQPGHYFLLVHVPHLLRPCPLDKSIIPIALEFV